MEQFPPTPGQNYNDGCGCPLPPNQHGVGSYGQQFNQPGQGILATPPMQYGTVPMIPLMSMNLNMPYSQPCPPFPYSSNTPPHNSPEYHQQQQPRNRPPGSRQGPRNQGNQGLSRASSTMSVDSIHSDTSDGRRQGKKGRGRPFRGRGGPYGKQSRQRKEYEDGESDGEMEAVAVDNATDINVDEAKETTTKARRQNKRNRKRRVKGQVRRGGQTNNTTDEHIDEASSGTEDEVMLVNENTERRRETETKDEEIKQDLGEEGLTEEETETEDETDDEEGEKEPKEIVELEYIESVVDENAVVEEEIDNKAGHEDTEEVRAGRKRNPRQRGRARKTSSNKDYDSVQTGCKFHHTQSKSTYIWQVKMWGEWREILNQEGAEQLYCKPGCNHSESFEDIDSHLTHCQLEFKPILQAIISSEIVELSEVEARRLSTRSYSQVKHRETGFATQWRWYWKDNSGTWMLFDSETYHYHRENYKWKYLIDFNAMIQTNIDTGAIREIRRRPLFVSQADVVQRNYPAGLSASPEIPAILPPDWTPWDLANQFELVKLAPTDPAYIQTMSRVDKQIQDIFRMQNPTLWLRFCNQEKTMLANQRRCGDESPVKKLLLFHGTDSLDAVRGISVNNFDPRVSGKNATVYGEGAYFARDAKYSHRYTKGSGLMFQAVVLVGYSTNGKKDYRRPPEKPGQTHELYDSCVNDINDPSIYILFEKNQYYPEYLIQYVDLYRAPSPPPVRPVTRPRHSIPGVNTGTTGAVFTCSAGSIAPYGSSSTGATGMYGTTSSSSTSHIPGSTSPTSPSGSYSTGAYTGGTGNASTAASGSTSPVGGSGYRAGSSSGSRSTATTSGSTGTYARASANSAFLNVNVSPPKPDKSCAIQ
ncbi:PAR12-like protein [Mya arenaria]|uniref:Poly [ADP-ribose] polymerase n=1 Tax=Mya arenaria TaxID=6604 RepID=A0ABY7F100_MYAAR|nr:PAR12-like protein [Mya arenaria]